MTQLKRCGSFLEGRAGLLLESAEEMIAEIGKYATAPGKKGVLQ
jgi:hypothetical protein